MFVAVSYAEEPTYLFLFHAIVNLKRLDTIVKLNCLWAMPFEN